MKFLSKISVVLSVILVASLGFVGCATSGGGPVITPEKVQRSVDQIVGTFAIVRQKSHPDSKPAFLQAKQSLNVLVANEKWDVGAFGEVLASTGLSEFAGDNFALYISTGVSLIDLFTADRVDLSQVVFARAVIVGGATALNRVVQ